MAINIERLKEIIKANGFTAEMLGIAPKKDMELISQMKHFMVVMDIKPEQARENFSEEYWKDLGIEEKKYKIVKTRMVKSIYKDIYVAIPEDENTDNVDEYIENIYNLDNDYPDEEDDWEIDEYRIDEINLTADMIYERDHEEIWNYDDFDD